MQNQNPDAILPNHAFFDPTNKFITFIKSLCRGKLIVDCGCGNGCFSTKLKNAGHVVLPIDLYPRGNDFEYVQADTTTFKFPPNSVPVIARPNRGDWIEDTIKNALAFVPYVLYIGLKKHLDEDVFSLDMECEMIYDDAGNDGEVVYQISKTKIEKEERYMKTKYFLVQYQAAKDVFFNSWFEDGDNKWIGFTGGWTPKSPKDKILETAEVEDIHELDWKKTSIYRPNSSCGWLSRDGTFYGCDYQAHDLIADLILKKPVGDLEKEGWVRIWSESDFACQIRLSADQRNYLSLKGHAIKDTD